MSIDTMKVSLEQLRKRARELQRAHRAGSEEAIARVASRLRAPKPMLTLSEAQYVLAGELGFASWPRLVASLDPGSPGRVRREGDRVWLDGVPELRWGRNAEPTYLGALEAAFHGTARTLDLNELMGDSGLCFRLRWATRDGGDSWCGSGPAGEWPEEMTALNRATGVHLDWSKPPTTDDARRQRERRIVASIDRGWPILAHGAQMDMAVVFGYEAAGARVLLSDYWAAEHPCVMATAEAKEIGAFIDRIDPPAERTDAVRAGLELAVRRWHEGIVDPDPTSGATYYYGGTGYERWRADLGRFDDLDEGQRHNLYFLNSWTYSSLHQNRSGHAARYLRAANLGVAAEGELEAAAICYDRLAERLGRWSASDPRFGFVKQQPIKSWTHDVRADEIATLTDLQQLDTEAIGHLERALAAA
ncbi:MAG: hypothetical protein U0R50_11950 [Gaiellales bacterium]